MHTEPARAPAQCKTLNSQAKIRWLTLYTQLRLGLLFANMFAELEKFLENNFYFLSDDLKANVKYNNCIKVCSWNMCKLVWCCLFNIKLIQHILN